MFGSLSFQYALVRRIYLSVIIDFVWYPAFFDFHICGGSFYYRLSETSHLSAEHDAELDVSQSQR